MPHLHNASSAAPGAPVRRPRACAPRRAEIPGPEALERALAAPAARRPVPNLGYACLNMDLREQRPPIYTNRDCIKKTWDEKGLPWVSGLVLENTRALAALVQWNWEHDIHFFRRARPPNARRRDARVSARACQRAVRVPCLLASWSKHDCQAWRVVGQVAGRVYWVRTTPPHYIQCILPYPYPITCA